MQRLAASVRPDFWPCVQRTQPYMQRTSPQQHGTIRSIFGSVSPFSSLTRQTRPCLLVSRLCGVAVEQGQAAAFRLRGVRLLGSGHPTDNKNRPCHEEKGQSKPSKVLSYVREGTAFVVGGSLLVAAFTVGSGLVLALAFAGAVWYGTARMLGYPIAWRQYTGSQGPAASPWMQPLVPGASSADATALEVMVVKEVSILWKAMRWGLPTKLWWPLVLD